MPLKPLMSPVRRALLAAALSGAGVLLAVGIVSLVSAALTGAASGSVPVPTVGTPSPLTAEAYAATLTGLGEEAATGRAVADGYRVRVVMRDGKGFPVTAEYLANRIDLFVVGGVVTGARVG